MNWKWMTRMCNAALLVAGSLTGPASAQLCDAQRLSSFANYDDTRNQVTVIVPPELDLQKVQAALDLWNDACQLGAGGATPDLVAVPGTGRLPGENRSNSILFEWNPGRASGSTLAEQFIQRNSVTFWAQDSGGNAIPWNDDNYRSTIGHEVGHALGLDHDFCQQSIMFGVTFLNNDEHRVNTAHCLEIQRLQQSICPQKTTGDEPCELGPETERPPRINPCEEIPDLPGCSDPNGGGGAPWFDPCEFIPDGTVEIIEGPWCIDGDDDGICDPPAKSGSRPEAKRGTWFCPAFLVASPSTFDAHGPWISMPYPSEGQTVAGVLRVGATVSHQQAGGFPVAVYVDGQLVQLANYETRLSSSSTCSTNFGEDPFCPLIGFAGDLDTRLLSNGVHRIQILAVDERLDTPLPSWFERTVVVENPVCLDQQAPTVALSTPAANATVFGAIQVTGTATDNEGVNSVDFLLDGAVIGTDLAAPWGIQWNTGNTTTGTHTLQARAADLCGNVATSSARTVTVVRRPEIAVKREGTLALVSIGSSQSIGTTTVGASTSVMYHLENTGNADLVLTNPNTLVSGACFQQIGTAPLSPLPAGQSTTFRVRLLCNTPGSYTGVVSIQNNDPDENPYTFHVTGTVSAPAAPEIAVKREGTLALVPIGGSQAIGTTTVGASISVMYHLENTGTANLVLSNPTTLVSGTCFQQIGTAPLSPLPPGQSTTFRVRLLCSTPGNYSGTVTIQNNDLDENPYTFTVTGTVNPLTSPEIAVKREGTLALVPIGGSQSIGTTTAGASTSVMYHLDNTGTADLVISNPTSLVSGSCFQQIGTAPLSPLPPGQSTTFRVRLLCSTPGNYSGTVTIQNNDLDENPYTFTVTGTVNPLTSPEIAVKREGTLALVPIGGSQSIGTTTAGASISVMYHLENTGTADLVISNPTSLVSGFCFHQIGTAPLSPLPPGQTTTLRVRLLCNTPGNYAGTVTIQNNDLDENPYTFTVTGIVN